MKLLKKYSGFLDLLTKILAVVLTTLTCLMCLTMFYQVIMRYCFRNARPWCDELTVYFSIYMIMMGIGLAGRNRGHLQVDFLLKMQSERVQALIELICDLLTIFVMIVIIKYSFSLIGHARGKSTTMPFLTMKHLYTVFPIMGVLSILYTVELAVKDAVRFFTAGKNTDKKGGEEA